MPADLALERGAGPAREARRPVGALVAGLAVLRCLSRASHPLRLTAIAQSVDLAPSTTKNILHTLAIEGHVHHDPQTQLYALGLAPLALAAGVPLPWGSPWAMRATLNTIAARFTVTIGLWRCLPPDRMALVMQATPRDGVAIRLRASQPRLPPPKTATDDACSVSTVTILIAGPDGGTGFALSATTFSDRLTEDCRTDLIAAFEPVRALLSRVTPTGSAQPPRRGGKTSMPPSIGSVTPVTQRASGPHR